MSPAAKVADMEDDQSDDLGISLLDMASSEIESKRRCNGMVQASYRSFPPACLALLKGMEGNGTCIDCGEQNPQWATVSFGALVCLQCSGHHRSLGVHVSRVRSISMDEWTPDEVVAMLEGGNSQLGTFFARHALTASSCGDDCSKVINKDNVTRLRYKTKAAEFYREQMRRHAAKVLKAGPYRGREMSRRKVRPSSIRRSSD